MPDWLVILLGLVLLIAGADVLVKGSQAIALALGIRPLVVGLTVVAFGTSAPELAAAVASALDGRTGMATGTVFGSNVANIGLILGLTAVLRPLSHSATPRFEASWLLLVTSLTPLPMFVWGHVPRWMGFALLGVLLTFSAKLIQRERRSGRQDSGAAAGPPFQPISVVMVVLGLAGLSYGADWLVEGGKGIASAAGVSDQAIGIGIGIATSLPELAASLVAAARGNPELALGNVLGSNMFNICMVLGTTATLAPLPMAWETDGLHVLTAAGITILLVAMLLQSPRVSRAQGGLLLAAYVAYMVAVVLQG